MHRTAISPGASCCWPPLLFPLTSRSVLHISAYTCTNALDGSVHPPADPPCALERARLRGNSLPIRLRYLRRLGLSGRCALLAAGNPCGYSFQLPSQASTAKLGRRIWDPLAVRAGQCWALQAMGTALLFRVNNTLLGVVCRGRPRRFPDAFSVGFASKAPPSICTLHLAVHYQMPIPESSWRSLHIAGAHTATLRRYSRCYPCNVDL